MFRRKSKQHARERTTEYATCRDFQQIFSEDMAGLHRLAFLLTADQAKAERCFVAGLEESIRGNAVFRQWARAWSKRAVIQNAIKIIAPAPPPRMAQEEMAVCRSPNQSGPENTAADVVEWAPFERFVFVMAVLEGYSLRECATLLACQVQDVIAVKSLALKRLAAETPQAPATPQGNDIPWTAKLARAQVA
jgi:DNA-directed RNA polymerase specialized sigma24 family protein